MLEATHKKLQEAEFFLAKLTAEDNRFARFEPEARDFYLSALLSAGRSVGDVISAEEKDRYRNWFAQRHSQLSAREKDLLKFMNEQRVYSVHVLGPELRSSTVYVPIQELQWEIEASGGRFEYFSGGVPGEPVPPPMVGRSILKFDDASGSSVVAMCREWLDLVKKVIAEYQQYVVA